SNGGAVYAEVAGDRGEAPPVSDQVADAPLGRLKQNLRPPADPNVAHFEMERVCARRRLARPDPKALRPEWDVAEDPEGDGSDPVNAVTDAHPAGPILLPGPAVDPAPSLLVKLDAGHEAVADDFFAGHGFPQYRKTAGLAVSSSGAGRIWAKASASRWPSAFSAFAVILAISPGIGLRVSVCSFSSGSRKQSHLSTYSTCPAHTETFVNVTSSGSSKTPFSSLITCCPMLDLPRWRSL